MKTNQTNNSEDISKKERSKRTPRCDGATAREIILETAGKVFATHGYADTTTKEICKLAGVNSAAVNYYFGGKKSLYEAVLVEAHKCIVDLDDLNNIIILDISPEEKLRAFFKLFIDVGTKSSNFWGFRVFFNEIMNPTQDISQVLSLTIIPKASLLLQIIHQITGLPPESDKAQRGLAFLLLPCVALFIFPTMLLRTSVLPGTVNDDEALLNDMVRYAMGGLQALSKE